MEEDIKEKIDQILRESKESGKSVSQEEYIQDLKKKKIPGGEHIFDMIGIMSSARRRSNLDGMSKDNSEYIDLSKQYTLTRDKAIKAGADITKFQKSLRGRWY